jgi:hypothetical protein
MIGGTIQRKEQCIMPQVPKTATSRTKIELATDLRLGYDLAFGQPPTVKTLACAYAQNALENAYGKAVWNFNFGNITCGKAWKDAGKDYYTIRVAERLDKVNHPDKWTTIDLDFRSFASAEAGTRNYWEILSGRYASVLPLFAAGDPLGAAHRLSDLGYFTAHVEDTVNSRGDRVPGYGSNMVAIYGAFMTQLVPNLPTWVEPTDPGVCAVPDDGGEMRCLITTEEAAEINAKVELSLWELTGEIDSRSPPKDDEPNS